MKHREFETKPTSKMRSWELGRCRILFIVWKERKYSLGAGVHTQGIAKESGAALLVLLDGCRRRDLDDRHPIRKEPRKQGISRKN
jgi:hypothetical protein